MGAPGPADEPGVTVVGATDAFLAWGTGRQTPARAADGGLQVLGAGGSPHDDAAGALDGILASFPAGP